MTENETKQKLDSLHYKILHTSFCNKVYESEIKALCMAKDTLSEIQQYRAIGTVEDITDGIKQSEEEFNMLTEYLKIGTIEEFKALKEKQYNCTIKHLTNECSYKETGCSDCKGYWKIRKLLEKSVAKKPRFYAHNYYCTECGNLVGNNEFEWQRFLYCDKCGQKLDWE